MSGLQNLQLALALGQWDPGRRERSKNLVDFFVQRGWSLVDISVKLGYSGMNGRRDIDNFTAVNCRNWEDRFDRLDAERERIERIEQRNRAAGPPASVVRPATVAVPLAATPVNESHASQRADLQREADPYDDEEEEEGEEDDALDDDAEEGEEEVIDEGNSDQEDEEVEEEEEEEDDADDGEEEKHDQNEEPDDEAGEETVGKEENVGQETEQRVEHKDTMTEDVLALPREVKPAGQHSQHTAGHLTAANAQLSAANARLAAANAKLAAANVQLAAINAQLMAQILLQNGSQGSLRTMTTT